LKYAALGSGEMATLILGFLARVAQMPAVARVK
jgi:hypothetical protein